MCITNIEIRNMSALIIHWRYVVGTMTKFDFTYVLYVVSIILLLLLVQSLVTRFVG